MVDLGLKKKDSNTSDYETKYLSDLKPGDEIEGEIHIGDIKEIEIKNREVHEFFVILTNHENEEKWICGIVTSYYPQEGNIYGEKDGRVYTLIDSLNHVFNKTPLNAEDSYSVLFHVFSESTNKNVKKLRVNAVQSWKPGAKSVNLKVMDGELELDESSKINDLADSNQAVKIAYKSLKSKSKEITKKTVAFELKTFLDKGEITRDMFKEALHELDKL